MNLKVTGNRVLVKPIPKKQDEKIGSLYVPNTLDDMLVKGEIIVIGAGKNGEKMVTSPGDKVYFVKGVGTPIVYDQVDYLLMVEDQIALIEPKEKEGK